MSANTKELLRQHAEKQQKVNEMRESLKVLKEKLPHHNHYDHNARDFAVRQMNCLVADIRNLEAELEAIRSELKERGIRV